MGECLPCPAGTFSAQPGQAGCLPCGSSAFSPPGESHRQPAGWLPLSADRDSKHTRSPVPAALRVRAVRFQEATLALSGVVCVDEMSLGGDFNMQTGSRRNTLREPEGQACSKGQDGVLAGTLRLPGWIPIRCCSSEALQGIRGRAVSQGPLADPLTCLHFKDMAFTWLLLRDSFAGPLCQQKI